MQIRLLGEVQLSGPDGPVDLGTPREQTVLAALAVDAGRPVPVEVLVDRVWGDAAPVKVRGVLYAHLSRIRRRLTLAAAGREPSAAVERRPAGYVLGVDPDSVDVLRFRRLASAGGVAELRAALALWGGVPLAGIGGEWAEQMRDQLRQQRVSATIAWAELELGDDHAEPVVAALPGLIVENPLVEPLEVLLLRALHAIGRTAEAVERYDVVRRRLADALGTDPGPELQELHQELLRGTTPAEPAPAADRLDPPAQLPAALPGFAGRDDEMSQLDALLDALLDEGAAGVITLSGMAGVGKTTLAMHWAHRVADRFPDGQLFVNLRGFDPAGAPVPTAVALHGFLVGLGVASDRIPADPTARTGLYQSRLAGLRVLVVIDNAADAEQVRPLLPGTPGCLTLVTSRDQLTGLVATAGARPLTLAVPTAEQARLLLTRRLGTARAAAEPEAMASIVTACGRLPLALSVAAARAAAHPAFPLATIARELGDARGRLDSFAGRDPATDIRSVFSWSYRQLSPVAAAMFPLTALHPGPRLTPPAAASLAAVPIAAATTTLAELTGAHLLIESEPGRFTSHDLLRAYAAELASTLPETDLQAAFDRLLAHYCAAGYAAARLVNPQRDPIPVEPLPAEIVAIELRDHNEAMAWFAGEHQTLLALIDHCARNGRDGRVWPLAWTLQDYLYQRGLWEERVQAQRSALEAVTRIGDRWAQAIVHRGLGSAYTSLNQRDDASHHYEQALTLSRAVDDHAALAHTHINLSTLHDEAGRHHDALRHAQEALSEYRTAAHRAGEADALNSIGWCLSRLGNHRQALEFCGQALTLHQETGSRWGQALTWDSLGRAHHHLGEHDRAIACYRTAIDLLAELGNRYYRARALMYLGDIHQTVGSTSDARQAWRHAAEIFNDLDHPEAADVESRLRDSDP